MDRFKTIRKIFELEIEVLDSNLKETEVENLIDDALSSIKFSEDVDFSIDTKGDFAYQYENNELVMAYVYVTLEYETEIEYEEPYWDEYGCDDGNYEELTVIKEDDVKSALNENLDTLKLKVDRVNEY